MIFLLAVRDIVRNRKNSIIITLLISVITALFFTGNSLFTRSNSGLRQSYVDNLTGDIIIEKKTDVSMNLFGANAPVIEDFFSIPVIGSYLNIMEILKGFPEIQAYTSQVSVQSYFEVFNFRSGALLCGVDAATYFDLFPGIQLVSGDFLKAGEYGAMITRERAAEIERVSGQKLEIGTPLMFTSAGDIGFRIREVPLAGIFSYTAKGRFINDVIIIDVQTARALAEIQVATSDVEAGAEQLSLLDNALNIDDIFGGELFMEASPVNPSEGGAYSEGGEHTELGGVSPLESALDYFFENNENLSDLSGAGDFSSGGDWNFIIIRLKKGADSGRVIKRLNVELQKFDAIALNWRFAAGGSAILILLLQALFNAGIALVGFAGVIAIINIMLIAVFRRTREIGTLRAIGAGDFYIRALILCENGIIGIFAGLIGVIAGIVVLRIVNGMNININNELIAGLLGGDVLAVDFSPFTVLLSFLTAFVLSIIASIYPVETAVKIQPIVAIRN
ncbi:MAG: FtsX-like permease family protein [Spirochaetaceae bacterium]|nr:FtsX-like permease family protein [Spirochaetaceae bacterium]